ncbi:MAG: glutamine--fructose-6-phosphate transaminase (isomerizing) [Muribaculaceae bacterium]|nr:glutamine--fructose-6-phosphate transaminase (isomerizing) [Muribaculaceae bacterium]
MCGIVGYVGRSEAFPILIGGLKKLEYRGYDSAGCALVHDGSLNVYKAKGKVSDLESSVEGKDTHGTVGIAHTRWATHGVPSVINAHPHVSLDGEIALVHNGIIENYAVLKENLQKKGVEFMSETDTEIIVKLIEYIKTHRGCDLATAVRMALHQAIGAYAIAVIDKNAPDELIVARKSSPLAIGIGKDNEEFYIASDASPIAEYTKQVTYLNDEEVAIIKRGQPLKILTILNQDVEPNVQTIDLNLGMLSKGGFPHFMLKEIFDQPTVLRDCMRGRLMPDRIVLSAVENHKQRLLNARRFIVVSCGTSWHAGMIGKQLIETFCDIPVEVEYASEFRYRHSTVDKRDVVIAISQSGETADTLAAIEKAKACGAFIFGIVNAVGSSIARATDTGIYIHVGPEIGVASTKAFTGQTLALTMLALSLGHANGTLSEENYRTLIGELGCIPDKIDAVLKQNDSIRELSRIFTYAHNFLYLGRGYNFPVALEGALKLKEISYIHAEGYPAAEMKHGPIALVDREMPVVFIATHHKLLNKIMSNMMEVKSRGGRIIAIVTEGDTDVRKIADEVIEVPNTENCLVPLLSVIPLQLLAYHVAVAKGLNVDQPRNLAKSVTVE